MRIVFMLRKIPSNSDAAEQSEAVSFLAGLSTTAPSITHSVVTGWGMQTFCKFALSETLRAQQEPPLQALFLR